MPAAICLCAIQRFLVRWLAYKHEDVGIGVNSTALRLFFVSVLLSFGFYPAYIRNPSSDVR